MNGRVKGKVALVTGAALGIGNSCARLLAENGAAVAATDVLDAEGERVADEIRQSGGTCRYWHLDVSKEGEVESVMQSVKEEFGRITVLVNNAGISGVDKPTHELESEDWDELMAVNLKGVFFCTKHALRQMLEVQQGSIINVSSIYGIVGAPDVPPYHASKGAVRLMTKTDALLYAERGIRVNSVHPGFIWTPMVEHYLQSKGGNIDEHKMGLAALHPVGRIGDPDDVSYGILYLASDESKFVTGAELIIDGGYTAR